MRILLILTTTIAAIIGCLVLIVGVALHRMKAADREADSAWATQTQLAATQSSAATTPTPTDITPETQPSAPAAPARPVPILLFAIDAKLRGQTLWKSDGIIGNWKDVNAYVEWPLTAIAGDYNIECTYSLGAGPRKVLIEAGGQTASGTVTPSGNWDHYITTRVGSITLGGGDMILRIKPAPGIPLDDALMHLRSVSLVPPGMTAPDPTTANITLSASNVELHGDRIKRSNEAEAKIVNWISQGDYAEWAFKSPIRQNYRAQITLSNAQTTGGDFDLLINREILHCHAGSTGDFSIPRTVPLGSISIPAGRVNIQIKPAGEFHNALMNLWKVEFFPE